MWLIYLLVIFLGTFIGAITGVGGGVIIKPVLDLVSSESVLLIGVYSAIAVFTMATTSLVKHYKQGTPVKRSVVFPLALGSLTGGYFGDIILKILLTSMGSPYIKVVQNGLLILLFVAIIIMAFRSAESTYLIKGRVMITLLLGLLIGALSSFLGIGGGPLNIALLTLFYTRSVKEAAVYSLTMIFFTQLPKIMLILVNFGTIGLDIKQIPAIILIAILGGLLGTKVHTLLSANYMQKVYIGLVLVLILISSVNLVMAF